MSAPRIYTRLGDAGQTGLFGSVRVDKDDVRVVAYGLVDELSAFIGWAVAGDCGEWNDRLQSVQHTLFDIGADLATPESSVNRARLAHLVEASDVARLEAWIDECAAGTPALRAFILPGGTEPAARLHIARCACRAAERAVVTLAKTAAIRNEILAYLNRLSDLLFAVARFVNHARGTNDIIWNLERGRDK